MFPKEAGPSLAHFADAAPKNGQRAPNFVLQDLAGHEVELAKLIGQQPIVIQLGSYTCPVFRYRRFDMHPLREQYQNRVKFLVVYTQEAHPVGVASPYSDEEWVPWINRLVGVDTQQTFSLSARQAQARFAQEAMQSNALFVVDDLGNEVWKKYGRAPSAAFLIDTQGRIVLRQPWVDPHQLALAIDELLKD